MKSTDLAVSANGVPNMSVNVAQGWAAIVGDYTTNMGTYQCYNDGTTNLLIAPADGSNPRIDLICMTVSDSYYTGALNQVAFNVVTGVAAPSPSVPATPTNSIALARVAVGAGAVSITAGNITDVRVTATTPIEVDLSSVETAIFMQAY
jgi:hypothetical protein